MKIEAKIIMEHGVISFEGEHCDIVNTVYKAKLEEARHRGKREVIGNILRNVEKIAS